MSDPVKAAERIVRRAGWLAPQDGCRGREVRTRRTSLRWFSWRAGFFGRRGHRWWVHCRWSIGATSRVLVGVYTYKDEDDERCIDVGLWPFLWEIGIADWPLTNEDIRRIDAARTASGSGSSTEETGS